MGFEIESPFNNVDKSYIEMYTSSRRRRLVEKMIGMWLYYEPIFEEALAKEGMPLELKYLPIIESALNPNAVSPAGAAGLWQFILSTGRGMGLEVNSLVDERRDTYKASQKAAEFLKSLYKTYDDWSLAIAAYNCGPGNVNKAIHRAGGKRDFWSIYPFLPSETRAYLPLFIAAAYAMNYADVHGICPADLQITMKTDTIVTYERQHLQQVADNLNIPLSELRRLNPQYARDILPGGEAYALCLPIEKAGSYIDQQDSIIAYRAKELIHNRRDEIELLQRTSVQGAYSVNGVTYYKIKEGDTLGGIAKKFHVSVKQLKAWNGLKSDIIRAGKTLKIGR